MTHQTEGELFTSNSWTHLGELYKYLYFSLNEYSLSIKVHKLNKRVVVKLLSECLFVLTSTDLINSVFLLLLLWDAAPLLLHRDYTTCFRVNVLSVHCNVERFVVYLKSSRKSSSF